MVLLCDGNIVYLSESIYKHLGLFQVLCIQNIHVYMLLCLVCLFKNMYTCILHIVIPHVPCQAKLPYHGRSRVQYPREFHSCIITSIHSVHVLKLKLCTCICTCLFHQLRSSLILTLFTLHNFNPLPPCSLITWAPQCTIWCWRRTTMTSNTPSPTLRPEPMPEWEPKVSTPHSAIPKDLTRFSKVGRFLQFCNFPPF